MTKILMQIPGCMLASRVRVQRWEGNAMWAHLVLSSGCAITVTVKPPKDMLAWENLLVAGCVGHSLMT